MDRPDMSPNRRAKRQEIVAAAAAVLLSAGLDRFTTRALTEYGSFSRSAIHYYFDSVEEIIDAAMANQLEIFLAALRREAADQASAVERFWAVTRRYLAHFSDQPALTLLWFDYSIAAVQAGRSEPVLAVETQLQQIFGELLRACDTQDWQARSAAVVTFMLGATLRGVLHPSRGVGDVQAHLAALSGVQWEDRR